MATGIPEQVKQAADRFRNQFDGLRREIHKVIVGHNDIVEGVLVCLFTGGHALLEGVPGLGKTLLVRTLAESMQLEFCRIQFTPDLMPADIIGTNIIVEDPATGRKEFRFERGPLFAHIVLADEINRATPKTQSALLEAMQESRSPSRGSGLRSSPRSSSWPRRTRSRRKAPTRCPRPSSTGSSSNWSSSTRAERSSTRSSTARPAARTRRSSRS